MDCKEGIVTKIANDHVIVHMVRSSACSGCHAKGVCHSGDAKEELLTVTNYPDGLVEGDKVRILFSDSKGLMAVVFAFVIPLSIIVLGVSIMSYLDMSEGQMTLYLLLAMAIYYLMLSLLKKRFTKTFQIKVERIQNDI
ncbi:SoxR reducing system RseC family protein [Porphyromonas sp.]|uniref:SoxR reducing system RseC family protein n=1 Tax=Porphyromonas sp. TaxID=1924944 RepID=UPI0026DADF4F|nr:SoxR reducing system RseC family protein [Porphyromonas sp.]MDO4695378.1 SoxR reducing system RseC family protein [Porphyromonas sp.]MDO4770495.1 SoxR reducing system RseC family protein [Porphyromonas sp.]